MKNTMKKLLSLVLVAMLLVCAVPFQAAATEADETLTVKTYVDGKYVTDKYVTVKPGQKLELTKELAETLIYGDKEFVKWTDMKDEETTGPISYDNLKKANANGYYVNLYLNKKVEDTRVDAKVPVKIYVDGSYARDGEITVPEHFSYENMYFVVYSEDSKELTANVSVKDITVGNADMNFDGKTDICDLVSLNESDKDNYNCNYDINADGYINENDLNSLKKLLLK